MEPQPKRVPDWTILKTLEWTTSYFKSNHIDSPRIAAEILLSHALSLRRIDLYIRYDQPLAQAELTAFKSLIRRRVQREPAAYIVGTKEFWSMDLSVSGDVLIPRPDTECIVEAGINWLAEEGRPCRVLELGTGSGAIVLALAKECPGHHFFASDISIKALAIAQGNAVANGLAGRVHFFASNWMDAVHRGKQSFDLILSNPPYIPTEIIDTLAPEICRYEPRQALDGGPDGCSALAHIVEQARGVLHSGGGLLLEMGFEQRSSIVEIAKKASCYEDIAILKDYGGNDRVAQLRCK